jgi:hypothetical protein
MSVVLDTITEQTTEADVEIAGFTVKFTYKPYVITLGMSMQLADGGIEMLSVLADVIEGWDLVKTEGVPFPVTEDNLKLLPMELATKMAQAITGDSAEVAEEGKG